MIGMVRKDRRRTKQLFGKHRAGQQVRPSCLPEGEKEICGAALFFFMTVSGTDQKARFPLSKISPPFEFSSQFHG